MSKGIRVGILGYGYAGEVIHAPLLESVDEMSVVAVSTSRDSSARTARSRGYRVHESPADLLSSDDIDLVVIATPHDTHLPLTRAACEAGKHVVCDKLMALNVAEAEEMIAAAASAGVTLSVFHNRRWDGDYLTVRAALGLADPGHASSNASAVPSVGRRVQIHSWVYSAGAPNPSRWRAHRSHGGGTFSDWGAHLMDQALELSSSPVADVFCDMRSIDPSVDVETSAHLIVRFEDGGTHIVETRNTYHASAKGFDVWGSDGRLTISGFDPRENLLNVAVRGAERRAPDYAVRFFSRGESEHVPAPEAGDWAAYYRNVADHLVRGADLAVRPDSVLRMMKLREAAYVSAEEGRAVEGPI